MRLTQPVTAADLAQRLGARLLGDGSLEITGINEIHHVEEGDLSFVDHPKYYAAALNSAASAVLIDREAECPEGKALLVVPDPFSTYNKLVLAERPYGYPKERVDPSARIGELSYVAPSAVIGPNVIIGEECHIGPNVVVRDGTIIGDKVVIGAGTVIGEEAFYYKKTPRGYHPWRSGGHVVIESSVDIGPNCTIARGVSSATVIGFGTKMDALVQIGHDCKIGRHCILAAQVGIAGNTTVGDWCLFQGQVGVAQNLTIGERCVVLAKSGVSKDLEGHKEYFGYPAQEARTAFKDLAVLRQLRKK